MRVYSRILAIGLHFFVGLAMVRAACYIAYTSQCAFANITTSPVCGTGGGIGTATSDGSWTIYNPNPPANVKGRTTLRSVDCQFECTWMVGGQPQYGKCCGGPGDQPNPAAPTCWTT